MTVKKMVLKDGKLLSITIEGKFDFSLHQSFRDSYKNYHENNAHILVDLSKTTYMDSSALGMLLLLKDHAEKDANLVTVDKPNETVKKILEIAQFNRLLTIQ